MTHADMAKIRAKDRARMLRYLRKRGVVVREDVGGAVGVYWTRADRVGRPFDQIVGDRLLEGGCVIKGERHQLVRMDFLETPSFCLAREEEAA